MGKHMYLKVADYQNYHKLNSDLLLDGGYELSSSAFNEGRHMNKLEINESTANTLEEAKDKYAKRSINRELKKGNYHVFRHDIKE